MRANVISVSGGKDSTATLLLALERQTENLSAVFCDTGHEHQSTYDYVDYLESTLKVQIKRLRADFTRLMAGKRAWIEKHWADDGVPADRIKRALELVQPTGNPFLDLCLWKGRFPSPKARFCTQYLKVLPINDHLTTLLKDHSEIWSWQGVRADESRSRALLSELDQEHDFPGVWNYRPILKWTADDCFAMHRKHDIKWNPLYEQGMGRVGCMPCIMVRKDELAEIVRRFPEELDRLAEWERLVSESSKRGSSTFFDGRISAALLDNDDIKVDTHGVQVFREWALTGRGGRQQDWIKQDTDIPVCRSEYGLCE